MKLSTSHRLALKQRRLMQGPRADRRAKRCIEVEVAPDVIGAFQARRARQPPRYGIDATFHSVRSRPMLRQRGINAASFDNARDTPFLLARLSLASLASSNYHHKGSSH